MRITIIRQSFSVNGNNFPDLENLLTHHEVTTHVLSDEQDLIQEQKTADIYMIDVDAVRGVLSLIDYYINDNKRVIAWVSDIQDPLLSELFRRNLHGYFYQNMEDDEIIQSVDSIIEGKKYLHPALCPNLLDEYARTNKPLAPRPIEVLSQREWEILELLTKGYKNEQIAEALSIAPNTVKKHVSEVLQKLGVQDRTNAILKALHNRWFALEWQE